MALLNAYIDEKLADIANELPKLVEDNPASFMCGLKCGYKDALLHIERFLDSLDLPTKIWNKTKDIF